MSAMIYQYNFPTTIRFGAGAIKELPAYLKANGLRRPMIATDATVAELDFMKAIINDLSFAGLDVEVFSDIHSNPLKSDVVKGGDYYKQTQRDSIVGIGGGAALDVARAIVLRVNHHRDLFDYDDLIGGEIYVTEEVPHFVTVPTTSGTGSEVGRSAVISEDKSKKKRILFSPKLLAKTVFADPILTMELPPFITAATGMDALTHNIEAYLAKGFHPICDGIALEGIKLIAKSLVSATTNPDIQSRSDMLLASLMGAVAFQKGLGIVHSLAHPMSSLLDTHHGLANAVNLPYGLAYNYEGLEGRYNDLALAFGLGSQAGSQLVERLKELNAELGLPTRLSDVGVNQGHIERLSELATQDFCLPSNPKPASKEDFINIYQGAL
ncbi:MAG: iron-containing alcohol dehydrogenase [Cyclobacteriaceae bacterium]